MTDDDDLFEREMAAMGVGPGERTQSARQKGPLGARAQDGETPSGVVERGTEATERSRLSGPTESESEAALIFEAAMEELWGEAPSTFESPREAERLPEVTREAPRVQGGQPSPSPTEESRLFEESIRELVEAPVKEADQAESPAQRDPWSESTEVIKRLIRRGKIGHDSELDLHGMTQREARAAVQSYLTNSVETGARMVRIVCGRGLHSRSGSLLLRDTLPTWLKVDFQLWVTRAFRAPREQGGEGAWYAILRRP